MSSVVLQVFYDLVEASGFDVSVLRPDGQSVTKTAAFPITHNSLVATRDAAVAAAKALPPVIL